MNSRTKVKKYYGQHFLTDGRIADRIIGYADISPGDSILEIGPGKGILTVRLLEKGAHVTAVEIDRELAGILRERFSGRKKFRLIH